MPLLPLRRGRWWRAGRGAKEEEAEEAEEAEGVEAAPTTVSPAPATIASSSTVL